MTAVALDIAFVRVLGPVQVVTTSGDSVDLGSRSQRRLVALLAAEARLNRSALSGSKADATESAAPRPAARARSWLPLSPELGQERR